MLGWLALLSRYCLFKETIRVLLQALRKHKPGLYENVKAELSRDYLQDGFDLTEKDKDKTRGRIKEMAQDLYLLKSAFEHNHQVMHFVTFKTLVQVFEQQCVITTKEESSPSDDDSTAKETVEVADDTATTEPEVNNLKPETLYCDAGAARHHKYMGNTEYRKECGSRAGAESLVNEIANAHNGRQSRHRNENGSRLQLILAGISCNVKRFVRFTQNCTIPVNQRAHIYKVESTGS
ncbi:MAG: hypothetical protein ACI8PB_005149 [Desulforhopalus sp.]|jgi:hypothetical protein